MSQENPAEFTPADEAALRANITEATAKAIFDSTAVLLIPLLNDRRVSEETKKAVLRICCERAIATIDGDIEKTVKLQKDGLELLISKLGKDFAPEFELEDIL